MYIFYTIQSNFVIYLKLSRWNCSSCHKCVTEKNSLSLAKLNSFTLENCSVFSSLFGLFGNFLSLAQVTVRHQSCLIACQNCWHHKWCKGGGFHRGGWGGNVLNERLCLSLFCAPFMLTIILRKFWGDRNSIVGNNGAREFWRRRPSRRHNIGRFKPHGRLQAFLFNLVPYNCFERLHKTQQKLQSFVKFIYLCT